MVKELKEIELIVDNEETDLISAMGFVQSPAIRQPLVYFNEKNNYVFANVDSEKGIIVSPALIPEKRIFRYDPFLNEEYYVYFSRETIEKLSQNFIISGYHNNSTEQHIKPISGVHLIYSWIVENQHDPLITKYGYKQIPNGTWAVMYKINNEDIKEKIKSGEINGLSVEAWITEKYDNRSSNDDKLLDEIKKIIEEN